MSIKCEVKGEVIKVELPKEYGSNGFRKSAIIVQTSDEYAQTLAVEFIKDKADQACSAISVGDQVTIQANVQGREYNGKFYTSLQGWRWTVDGAATTEQGEPDSGDGDDNLAF